MLGYTWNVLETYTSTGRPFIHYTKRPFALPPLSIAAWWSAIIPSQCAGSTCSIVSAANNKSIEINLLVSPINLIKSAPPASWPPTIFFFFWPARLLNTTAAVYQQACASPKYTNTHSFTFLRFFASSLSSLYFTLWIPRALRTFFTVRDEAIHDIWPAFLSKFPNPQKKPSAVNLRAKPMHSVLLWFCIRSFEFGGAQNAKAAESVVLNWRQIVFSHPTTMASQFCFVCVFCLFDLRFCIRFRTIERWFFVTQKRVEVFEKRAESTRFFGQNPICGQNFNLKLEKRCSKRVTEIFDRFLEE